MKVLAIRLARFGDIVLLMPALTLLKSHFPESRITFLTDERLASLASMCPAISDIIAVNRIAMRDGGRWATLRKMLHVLRDVRRRKFDLAIDFHGFRETNLLTWISAAQRRLGLKRFGESYLSFCFNLSPVPEDKSIHVSKMFLRVIERFATGNVPATPAMIVPDPSRRWAKEALPPGDFAALYVDAPTPLRRWPPEKFAALSDHIISQFGLNIVAVSGSDGAALVDRVRKSSKSSEKVCGFSNLTTPQLAAVVESARLLVSNDTGPMHLGPILGVPTLGLFSIGLPEHFSPTGTNNDYVLADPIEKISVEEVVGRVEKLWTIARPDPQR